MKQVFDLIVIDIDAVRDIKGAARDTDPLAQRRRTNRHEPGHRSTVPRDDDFRLGASLDRLDKARQVRLASNILTVGIIDLT